MFWRVSLASFRFCMPCLRFASSAASCSAHSRFSSSVSSQPTRPFMAVVRPVATFFLKVWSKPFSGTCWLGMATGREATVFEISELLRNGIYEGGHRFGESLNVAGQSILHLPPGIEANLERAPYIMARKVQSNPSSRGFYRAPIVHPPPGIEANFKGPPI